MTAGLVDGMRESLAQCRRLARLTHDERIRIQLLDVAAQLERAIAAIEDGGDAADAARDER